MSGRRSRNKGAAGEREFFNRVNELLGAEVFRRNLGQYQGSGPDATALGLAIEVKRSEKPSVGRWWTQAQKQAQGVGASPILAYRANNEAWQVLVGMTLEEFVEWLETYITVVPADGKATRPASRTGNKTPE